MDDLLEVYIGYDPLEHDAYQVAALSLVRNSSIALGVRPLIQADLRASGLYTRTSHYDEAVGAQVDDMDDKPFSTEFSFTRFLTPHIARSKWAVFIDCDFLILADIAELAEWFDPKYAVMCVKHDFNPTETTKMHFVPQQKYPRKNWSSLMAFNCEHPSNKSLTPEVVNRESGTWLHGMHWLKDEEIGALPEAWNWLDGWSSPSLAPKIVHHTRGGPWFENWQGVAYAAEWRKEHALKPTKQTAGYKPLGVDAMTAWHQKMAEDAD